MRDQECDPGRRGAGARSSSADLDQGLGRMVTRLTCSGAGFRRFCVGRVAATVLIEKGVSEMADVHKFSEQVIDLAERLEDVADAAKGKGVRRGSFGSRWVILPAAGAGLYALATRGSFARQAKGVMNQAKTRASELPDDLLSSVRQTSQKSATASGGRARSQTSSSRKTNSARKSNSAHKTRSSR